MKTKLHIKIMAVGFFIILFAAINLTAQDHWAKYENNPVLENTAWSDGAAGPVVIFGDDAFKMWFSSAEVIGYAESTDGIDWVTNDEPVIPAGTPGDWDEGRYPCSVLRINDTLKMWYSGSSDNFQYEISIGYAWSLDNIVWHLEADPVLENGEPGSWDETGVFQPVVYYDGATYHMWYSGFEGITLYDPMQEGYATSTDGINWAKHTNNPVIYLGEDGSFYDTWFVGTSVLFTDNEFHMWFAGWDGYSTSPFKYWRIGHATSPDGVEWTIQNHSMPVVDVGPAGSWDYRWARYSSVLIHEGQYKMWYDGKGSNTKIGFATGGWVGLSEINDASSIHVVISPNPFTASTIIKYELDNPEDVSVIIHNHLGKVIKSTVQTKGAGKHQLKWHAEGLPSGIYYYQLQAGEQFASGKIVKL